MAEKVHGPARRDQLDVADPRMLAALLLCSLGLVAVIAFAGNHAPDYSPEVVSEVPDLPAEIERTREGDSNGAGAGFGLVFVGLAVVLAVATLKLLTPRQLLRLLGAAVLLLLAVIATSRMFRPAPFPPGSAVDVEAEPEADTTVQGRDGPDPLWLAAPAGVVLLGIGVALARRRASEPVDDTTAVDGAVREVLADVETVLDPRRAVITAYARLEHHLARAGLGRRGSETSREYVERVLSDAGSDPEAIDMLGRLYEHARYDASPVLDRHRTEAIEALGRIRSRSGDEALA